MQDFLKISNARFFAQNEDVISFNTSLYNTKIQSYFPKTIHVFLWLTLANYLANSLANPLANPLS
jgi:hypothetical protein